MLHPDPGARTPLSRRRVLAGGGRGLLALALLGTAATACGHSGGPEPDPLEAQLAAARHDRDLAAAAAKAAPRSLVPALLVVADERARHAAALVEELSRAAGKPTPTETAETKPTADPSEPGTGGTKPAPPPSVGDVLNALHASADSAAKLAPTLSGYRAGLMGSIAAACTASYSVGLPPAPPPPPPPAPGKGPR